MSQTVTYRVEHDTEYAHDALVSTSTHLAYLTPRDLPRQHVVSHELRIDPAPADRSTRVDYFGNTVEHLTMTTPYRRLRATSVSIVSVTAPLDPPMPDASPAWESVRDGLRAGAPTAPLDAIELAYPSPYVEVDASLAAFARDAFPAGRPVLAGAIALMHQIHETFAFDASATTIVTPAARVLEDRRGVCQDFAHVQLACLRALGLSARYVSGYLLTDPPPGQPRLVGADASHAWISLWCPQHGWVDLDPTNDVLPSLRHVTLAWGRDYGDVSPLRGVVLGGGQQTLRVGVSVFTMKP